MKEDFASFCPHFVKADFSQHLWLGSCLAKE
jgi:hypothetical protein